MPSMPRRRQLVVRLWRAVEAEITALESRLGGLPPDDPAREEGAKQLGLIARLIRDLVALDQQPMIQSASVKAGQFGKAQAAGKSADAAAQTEEAAFADLASLRAALEKRLEALAAQPED